MRSRPRHAPVTPAMGVRTGRTPRGPGVARSHPQAAPAHGLAQPSSHSCSRPLRSPRGARASGSHIPAQPWRRLRDGRARRRARVLTSFQTHCPAPTARVSRHADKRPCWRCQMPGRIRAPSQPYQRPSALARLGARTHLPCGAPGALARLVPQRVSAPSRCTLQAHPRKLATLGGPARRCAAWRWRQHAKQADLAVRPRELAQLSAAARVCASSHCWRPRWLALRQAWVSARTPTKPRCKAGPPLQGPQGGGAPARLRQRWQAPQRLNARPRAGARAQSRRAPWPRGLSTAPAHRQGKRWSGLAVTCMAGWLTR